MATEARPGAVLGRASSPALRTLCVCSARTLHTPCTLRSRAEAASEREAHSFEKIDFDGRARAYVGCGGRLGTLSPNPLSPPRPRRYAIVWGDNHRTKTVEECAQRCLEWKPQPPSMYACNIFVFCPLEKCYAPAALPPGPMTGQCWLKHQPDPNKPQVNMKGCRSKSRPAQLPCSPDHSLAPLVAVPLRLPLGIAHDLALLNHQEGRLLRGVHQTPPRCAVISAVAGRRSGEEGKRR